MTIVGLTDPPPPSFAFADLMEAVVVCYWPTFLVTALASLLPVRGPEGDGRRTPSLVTTLPLLVWSYQTSCALLYEWHGPLYPSWLWHRYIVAYLGLGALGVMWFVLVSARQNSRSWRPVWPSPIWSTFVLIAPLIDWALLIFFTSPTGLLRQQ